MFLQIGFNLILNCLFCVGVYVSLMDGMIFGFVRNLYEDFFNIHYHNNWRQKLMYYLSKPLFNCLPCMGSIWGLVFYSISPTVDHAVISWYFLIHVVCLVGLNYIMSEIAFKSYDDLTYSVDINELKDGISLNTNIEEKQHNGTVK